MDGDKPCCSKSLVQPNAIPEKPPMTRQQRKYWKKKENRKNKRNSNEKEWENFKIRRIHDLEVERDTLKLAVSNRDTQIFRKDELLKARDKELDNVKEQLKKKDDELKCMYQELEQKTAAWDAEKASLFRCIRWQKEKIENLKSGTKESDEE